MSKSICNGRVIISDTTCLIGLTNIGLLGVLQQVYQSVTVTPQVAAEYGEALPSWIIVKAVNDMQKVAAYNQYIDLGESSAIALAMEIEDSLVILDDLPARQFAMSLGLEITGTLGVLIQAYKKGIVTDLHSIIEKLRANGFRLPPNAEELI
jgi:predicted nucleic acid-binding protein